MAGRPTVGLLLGHALLAEVLGRALAGPFRVLPPLRSVRDALRAARRGRPDVLLACPEPSNGDLGALWAGLRRLRHPPRVLVVARVAAVGWVQAALEGGAAGFLGPCADLDACRRAIECATRGESYLTPCAASVVTAIATGRAPTLSAREREVLRRICDGLSSKEIGRELRLTVKAVDGLRGRLIRRAGVRSSTALVRFACEQGFAASHARPGRC